jgi:choline kinase
MLMNADVLYPVELIKRLHSSKYDNVMAVDVKPCGDEEVKVIEGENKRIVAIGKKLIEENSLGEFIGVAKFSNGFMQKFFKSLDKLVSAGGKSDYFEAAIDPILSTQDIFYEDITDLPCKEIDFLEDFNEAKKLVKSHHYNA